MVYSVKVFFGSDGGVNVYVIELPLEEDPISFVKDPALLWVPACLGACG